jgi:hypothetical protein
MKTVTSIAEAMALGSDLKLYVDDPDSIRVYFPGEIPEPAVDENPVPQEVSKYKAMKALAAAGLAEAYQAWVSAPERTFLELAAVNATVDWERSDPALIAAATAIGLSSAQLDDLFRLADTL